VTDAATIEKAASLFQPDILLPAQYLDNIQPKSNLMPEKRLMLAVLEDGLCCFQKYCFASDEKGEALFKEAEAWIMDENVLWPFSFGSICDYLGIDAGYLRSGIFRWRDSQLASRAEA